MKRASTGGREAGQNLSFIYIINMKKFKDYLDTIGEYGIVTEIKHPIIKVEGLPKAKAHEVVMFETGEQGQVFSLEKDAVEVLVFSSIPIPVGTRVVRTNEFIKIPVGDFLLGTTINPLGEKIGSNNSGVITDKESQTNTTVYREVEIAPKGIHGRSKVSKPLLTGITLVDLMIPLGAGQKELVIGDRKTGKSTFLLSTLKNQLEAGSIAIYAGIARKQADIKRIQEFFADNNLMKNAIIVATTSHDAPSLIYLTPYTAMTIAEYFCELGRDVIVVLDDLSVHAKFYREISLLAKRFPGRDSYPGDIFYTHARLLERAGSYKIPNIENEVSITCLPVVETVEGDLTGYIQTNVMGMTDGHIFFDSNAYAKGRRPAINIELSVTRVGRQTQSPLLREISQTLSSFLNEYEKMQTFSHFGAELSGKVQGILTKGDIIYQFFDQSYTETIPQTVQVILFALIWSDLITAETLIPTKAKVTKQYSTQKKEMDEMINVKNIYELTTKVRGLIS
jgi:F-type H+-transporting ATPase subunit alpha